MEGSFLGVDWGTTNRRVYLIGADGEIAETERDGKGVLDMQAGDYAAEVAGIRNRFGDLPMVIAGMAGSNRGWVEAPYQSAPVSLCGLATGLHWVEPGRTAIVPGVSQASPADVMRGEEVQLLGAVEAGLVPPTSLLCQPGTHCKWAHMEDGALVSFATAMTGELFAMLARGSLLASQLKGKPALGEIFARGIERGAKGDLMNALFGVRANHILGTLSLEDSASYASGIIIGGDVAANMDGGAEVHILADENLGGFYRAAIEQLGGNARLIDSHRAFVAGITRLWKMVE